MKVSSSRAPPPNVTTTALRPRGVAIAHRGAMIGKALAAAAPVTSRRKVRRLNETVWAISRGLRRFAVNAE
jgi:hypothetical protein